MSVSIVSTNGTIILVSEEKAEHILKFRSISNGIDTPIMPFKSLIDI